MDHYETLERKKVIFMCSVREMKMSMKHCKMTTDLLVKAVAHLSEPASRSYIVN